MGGIDENEEEFGIEDENFNDGLDDDFAEEDSYGDDFE